MNDILMQLRSDLPSFSKGQKRIANYILESYDKAAFMTASRLGMMVEVSESTVVRFAVELGFDGYPSMQKTLQELVRNKPVSYTHLDVYKRQGKNLRDRLLDGIARGVQLHRVRRRS